MSDSVAVRNRIDNLDVSPRFDSYSKVIIHVSDDTTYEYPEGDVSSGRILEIDNPFGTKQMAMDLLQKLKGFQYQPYNAEGALLDPAAEIGDALNATSVYGGIYSRSKKFGRLMKADVSASQDEEIDHEYEYVSATERRFERSFGEVKATLAVYNDRIEAKVEADTSINRSVFGWRLRSDSWEVFAANKTVLKATESGLEVSGKITATSGKIGGFDIGTRAIYNNLESMESTATNGVYLGTDGIKLGQNFKVTTSGAVTASSLTLRGTLTFLNNDGTSAGTLTAANLRKYADEAYSSACKSDGYCYKGAGGGYRAINAFDNGNKVSWMKAASLYGDNISLGGYPLGRDSMSVETPSGTRTLYFVRW